MQNIDKRSEELSERAVLFRTLGQAFARPAEGCAGEMRAAFVVLTGNKRRDEISRYLQRTRDAWRIATDDRLAADYARLFADTGPVALHETAYGGRSMAGRAVALADIAGLYRAFGFFHDDRELADHVVAELAFVNWLLLKERYACTNGLRAQAWIAAQGTAAFLQQHLGRWVDGLELHLAAIDDRTPYYDLAALLAAAVEQECRRRQVRPESAAAGHRHEIA